MRLSVSSSQMPAIKRGIQLIRKAAKFYGIEYVSEMKLGELQNIIARAYSYGSFNEMKKEADKNSEATVFDFQHVDSKEWSLIRNSIKQELMGGVNSVQDGKLASIINCISWFPAQERDYAYVASVANEFMDVASDKFSIVESDHKKCSITFELNHPDYRYAYGYLSHMENRFTSISDFCFYRNDIVLYQTHSVDNKHYFKMELNDNWHNKQVLPQFAVVDVRDIIQDPFASAVCIVRGEYTYHKTFMATLLRADELEFFRTQKQFGISKVIEAKSIDVSLGSNGEYLKFTA